MFCLISSLRSLNAQPKVYSNFNISTKEKRADLQIFLSCSFALLSLVKDPEINTHTYPLPESKRRMSF